jgi:hypothetical protein
MSMLCVRRGIALYFTRVDREIMACLILTTERVLNALRGV